MCVQARPCITHISCAIEYCCSCFDNCAGKSKSQPCQIIALSVKTKESCNMHNANYDKNEPKVITCLNEKRCWFLQDFSLGYFFESVSSRTYASPAPKANDDLARAIFYTDCAKVKNGLALGVRVHAVVRRFSVFRYFLKLYANCLIVQITLCIIFCLIKCCLHR